MEYKRKNETDEKLLNAIMKIAAEEAWKEEINTLPSLEALNEMYPPSEALDKRVYGIINKAARCGKVKKILRRTARFVAAFCMVVVFVGGALMSVGASRTFILNRIINTSDDYVQISFQLGYIGDLKVGELVVNYIPDDFSFYEQGEFTEGHTFYDFKSDTRRGILIQHLLVSDDMGVVGMINPMTAGSEFSVISIHGQVAYLFMSADKSKMSTISWNYGRHFLSVSAFLDIDELIKIAKGMTLIMLP